MARFMYNSKMIRFVITCLTVLQISMSSVTAQTLSIRFEDFGSYNYNNGKAFIEDDQVRVQCDITGQIPSGSSVVFTRAKDASGTDLIRVSSGQTVLVPNQDNHLTVQHNVLPAGQNYKLIINGVNKYDQGFYKCRVETSNEVVTQTSGYTDTSTERPQLVVLYLPDATRYPECIVDEGTIDVKLGQKLNIKCVSEFGNPMVGLVWKRNLGGGQVEDVQSTLTLDPSSDDVDREMENAASTITIAADHDGDTYTCFMNPSQEFFPSGSRSCHIGPLRLVSGSLPTITPVVQNAAPGDTVTFQCDLLGQSDAVFTWYWEPNWDFEKASKSPDSKTIAIRNVRSYHHMTKVFCRTQSQGYDVSVYGLIRVDGDYEAPPNTPAPPVTFDPPEGNVGTGSGNDGNGDSGSGTGGSGTGGSGTGGIGTGGSGTGGNSDDDDGDGDLASGGGDINGRPKTTPSSSGQRLKYQIGTFITACLISILALF